MNCKQGDLAIFVRSSAGNEGKIVRCVRGIGRRYCLFKDGRIELRFLWEIDVAVRHWGGEITKTAFDHNLRPIRDSGDDAQDETLQWLDVPSKETV